MAYTTPRTWVAGEVVTAALLNTHLRDDVSFLANPPACRVRASGSLTHTSTNNWQVLSGFDTETYDTDNMHSTVTNTNRITFNTAGLYVVGGGFEFAANATGLRGIRISLTGATPLIFMYYPTITGGVGTGMAVETTYKFAINDYIELQAFQNSGGNLAITGAVDQTPAFTAIWIGLG